MSFRVPPPPPEPPGPLAPPIEESGEALERAPVSTSGRLADWFALFLSAILSPYIVIFVGTLGIIYARSRIEPDKFWLWSGISLFFSLGVPVLYILFGVWRGFITDVHVMEREQRALPFIVAIVGALVGSVLLWAMQAPASVYGLGLILAFNGLLIWFITRYTKISVHVSVLSATVLGAAVLHPQLPPFSILWTVPLLIWARMRRGRHTLWQGLGGFGVAGGMTVLIVVALGLRERIGQFFERLFT